MMDFRAADRYAAAFFELSEKAGKLDAAGAQLAAVLKLVEKHDEISHLLFNSTISLPEKEDFIGKIVPADTDELLVRFLKVLVRKKRFRDLGLIQELFQKRLEKKKGVCEVEAVTAVPLSSANESRLLAALKKKLGAEIRLVSKVEPGLIGGMILRFEGREINGSFYSRFEDLRQELILSNPR